MRFRVKSQEPANLNELTNRRRGPHGAKGPEASVACSSYMGGAMNATSPLRRPVRCAHASGAFAK